MGFLSKLVGLGIGDAANGIANVIDKFVETPEEKNAAKVVLTKIAQRPHEWQAEINKIEASHRTIFVAGWRPAIGWICALGLFWGWIVGPILVFAFPGRALPEINTAEALTLVTSLLGLGVLRTYEKKAKTTR